MSDIENNIIEILVESESIKTSQLKISRKRSKIQKSDSLDFCRGDIIDRFIEAFDERQRVKVLGPDNYTVLKCSNTLDWREIDEHLWFIEEQI